MKFKCWVCEIPRQRARLLVLQRIRFEGKGGRFSPGYGCNLECQAEWNEFEAKVREELECKTAATAAS